MALYDLGSGEDSAALKDIIVERISRYGPISFAEFMRTALYHPRHGYYACCDPFRDYQSSPNVHAIFGACIGRVLAEMWRRLGSPARFDVLECGAGNGRLAGDIIRSLRAQEPAAFEALHYRLQDVTYDASRTERVLSDLGLSQERVSAARDMPGEGEVRGCILSNELIDAFPVHRVRVERGRLFELRVGLDGERLVDVPAEAPAEVECYFERLGLLPGEGCEAEVNLAAPPWMLQAARSLERGYVLTLDYGYEAQDLYAPWRKRGTLLTFYRHTSGEDPYVRLGRQDMTSSVDFTTLMRAGEEAGLTTLGLTTQAEFLAKLGIGDAIARAPEPGHIEAFYALRRSVIELTDPTGLGRIEVLAQGKGVPDKALPGFQPTEHAHA